MHVRLDFLNIILLLLAVITGVVGAGIAWIFYNTFISTNSRINLSINYRTLQKGYARVTEKRVENNNHDLRFTYTDGNQTYGGALMGNEHEYGKTEMGEVMPIFYDVDRPNVLVSLRKSWTLWIIGGFQVFSMAFIFW